MKKIKVLTSFYYNNFPYQAGQIYDLDDEIADKLEKNKRIKIITELTDAEIEDMLKNGIDISDEIIETAVDDFLKENPLTITREEIEQIQSDINTLNDCVYSVDKTNIFDGNYTEGKDIVTWNTNMTTTNCTFDKATSNVTGVIQINPLEKIYVYFFDDNGQRRTCTVMNVAFFTDDNKLISTKAVSQFTFETPDNAKKMVFSVASNTPMSTMMICNKETINEYIPYENKVSNIDIVDKKVQKIRSEKASFIFSFDAFDVDNRFELMKQYNFPFTIAFNTSTMEHPISIQRYYELFINGDVDFSVYGGSGSMPDSYCRDVDAWYNYVASLTNSLKEGSGLYFPVMFSAPNQRSSDVLNEALKKLGFRMCRSNVHVVENGNGGTTEIYANNIKGNFFDGTDDYNYNCVPMYANGSLTLENIKGLIDEAITNKKTLMLFTHKVKDSTDSTIDTSQDCTTEFFIEVLEYIKEKRDSGLCNVFNARQYWNYYNPQDGADLDYKRMNMRHYYENNK